MGLLMSTDSGGKNRRTELEGGLKGLQAWLEAVRGYCHLDQYWDPENIIPKRIGEILAMLQEVEVKW